MFITQSSHYTAVIVAYLYSKLSLYIVGINNLEVERRTPMKRYMHKTRFIRLMNLKTWTFEISIENCVIISEKHLLDTNFFDSICERDVWKPFIVKEKKENVNFMSMSRAKENK